jgi:hypothetical protein
MWCRKTATGFQLSPFPSELFGLLDRLVDADSGDRFFESSLHPSDFSDQFRAPVTGRRNLLDRLLAVMESKQLFIQRYQAFAQPYGCTQIDHISPGLIGSHNNRGAAELRQECRGRIASSDCVAGVIEKL